MSNRHHISGSVIEVIGEYTEHQPQNTGLFWRHNSSAEMAEYCRQMFGMTQGSEQEITKGIKQYLGYNVEAGQVQMNWNLFLIKMHKALE